MFCNVLTAYGEQRMSTECLQYSLSFVRAGEILCMLMFRKVQSSMTKLAGVMVWPFQRI